MIPLVESEITPELMRFAELHNLENFPADYVIEKADVGYMITNLIDNTFTIVAAPLEGEYFFRDLDIYLNTTAVDTGAKEQKIAYGYTWVDTPELTKCATFWTFKEIRYQIRSTALGNLTDHSMEDFLHSVEEVVRTTDRYTIPNIINYMKTRGMPPFVSKIKWLN